jgi:photosystem II stability/assembly factor-like uncharacterized protein
MTGRHARSRILPTRSRRIGVMHITRAAAVAVLVGASPALAQSRPPRTGAAEPTDRVRRLGSLVMRGDLAGLARDSVSVFDPGSFKALTYRMVGPARGGRVTAVTGVPQEPHTFYMGATGGGVWKTTDAGITWVNLSDPYFEVGSIGSLDVADSDPSVVYVGTGSDGLRSNVSIGKGVYKSTDAGRTWTHVGLREMGQIGAVVIHPSNPDIVYAAAVGDPFRPTNERGVYRTRDGGRTWQRVLHLSDSTGAVDIELQPGNPATVYASMWRAERKPWTIISGAREGGVYKSTDGGDNWRQLTAGLPNQLVGKSDLAVSPAMPNRLYVLIEAKPGNGLYRSDDAGESFTAVNTTTPGLITRPFYYTNVDADPLEADVVYVGTEGFYKSTDGGRTFRTMRTPHGDNHDLWINPKNSSVMIQSNDGGANVSLDGGRTWSTQYNQPTAEIYQVYVDNQFPYRLYGAQQDNSTLIVPSRPITASPPDDAIQQWRQGPGCETGPIMPHRTNPDTVYGSCKGQYSRLSLGSGQEKQYWVGAQSLYGNPGKDLIYRFQRVSPMEVSPHDPSTLYYGSQHVHRTRDEGVTWERISPDLTANEPQYQQRPSGEPITIDVTGEEYYSTLYAIRESVLERGVIWTGSNDGPFYVSRDNGRSWTNVTPRGLPPGGRVQNIEPSPHRRGSAYYAAHRYLLGDWRPYIYRTNDYGRTWTLLTPGTNGIPADQPTRVVREDPDRPGLLYAGTEFGAFVSFDDGRRWYPLQLNLPHTPITDMKVHRKDLVLSTQGRSFWILDDLTPLHQMGDRVMSARAHLFRPRAAHRIRYSTRFGGAESERPAAPDEPQYPPPGANIDYWLSGAPTVPATLEIIDATGKVVRRFSSELPAARAGQDSAAVRREDEPGMSPPATERVAAARLPANQGLNRFIWDFAYPGPWDANPQRNGRNGPLAPPGVYTVRMTSGDWSGMQPLELRMDPRLVRDGLTLADLRAQLDHNLRVRDMVTEVNQAVDRLQRAKRRLQGATGAAADTLQRLNVLEAKLVTPPIRYSQPALQAHIGYLYGLTTRADQEVGRDAIERYRVLRKELDASVAGLNQILGTRQ